MELRLQSHILIHPKKLYPITNSTRAIRRCRTKADFTWLFTKGCETFVSLLMRKNTDTNTIKQAITAFHFTFAESSSICFSKEYIEVFQHINKNNSIIRAFHFLFFRYNTEKSCFFELFLYHSRNLTVVFIYESKRRGVSQIYLNQ